MEKTESFNETDALKVISAMIEATKSNVRENSFYYLLWGFLVLVASILEFCLLVFLKYPHHYIGWPVLMGVGLVVSLIDMYKNERIAKARSYIGSFFMFFFTAWTISLFILLFFIIPGKATLVQPVILAFYAMALFISGGILQFRPMLWGSSLAWIASIVSFFCPFPVQLLITAGTVILAYILPGILLKKRGRKLSSVK